jgi:hypothetical protein
VRAGRTAALAALALAAACSSGARTLGAKFSQPTALATFQGLTRARPEAVHAYLAVASARGDEVRFVDLQDDRVVVGPGVIFPLSVPTDPRPMRLAAASLGDGSAGAPSPDLLAVAGAGSLDVGASSLRPALRLQIVVTWDVHNRVDPALTVDLPAEDPSLADADLLSLAAMTIARPVTPGVPSPPGRARLLAGLSGGRLAVAEFERDSDPAATPGSLKRRGPLVVRDLGFDAVHLAVSPDGWRVFAATPDPLLDAAGQPVRGVAQIDVSGADPLAWPVTGLDARAPTRLVAAGILSERTPDDADLFGRRVPDPSVPGGIGLAPDPRLEVLAVLDESSCGSQAAIDCGIATLVPDDASRGGGIAADPAGQLPYRAPIRIGAMPLALVVVPPRAGGDVPVVSGQVETVMTIAPPTGRNDATAVGAVAAADGRIHLVDVGRWAEGNAVSSMRGAQRAAVASLDALGSSDTNKQVVGLWNDRLVESGQPETAIAFEDLPSLQKLVGTTPGFAQDDAWSVVWEGLIPGLVLRPGTVGLANGTPFVALQRPLAATTWITGGNIADPALGVRIGDIAFVAIPDTALCPPPEGFAVGGFEARVTGFLAPDPTWYPAGALAVDRLSDPDHTACLRDVADAAAPTRDAELSIRGQGLVLSGQSFGYAGRPTLSVDPGAAATETFVVEWQDEGALAAAAAAGDRSAGELLPIVRKARRRYYPTDRVCPPPPDKPDLQDLSCPDYPVGYDPVTGVVTVPRTTPPEKVFLGLHLLKFRAGPHCRLSGGTGCDPLPLLRDTSLSFGTQSGRAPWIRQALGGGSFPFAVTWYDKSLFPSTSSRGTQILAAFFDDQIIDFSPASSPADTAVVR